mgnify:CR=1 FL=1
MSVFVNKVLNQHTFGNNVIFKVNITAKMIRQNS